MERRATKTTKKKREKKNIYTGIHARIQYILINFIIITLVQ